MHQQRRLNWIDWLPILFTVGAFAILLAFLFNNVRETMLYHDTMRWNVPSAVAAVEGRPLIEIFNLLTAPFAVVHRNLFSRGLSAISAVLVGYDLRYEIGAMVVMQIISVAAITRLAWKSLGKSALFVMAIAATILFSMSYIFVWLIAGWTMMFVSGPVMAMGAALLFTGEGKPGPFIAVLFLLSFAVLSDVRGLVLWPLLTVGLWFTPYRRKEYITAWLIVMALSIASYFLLPGMPNDIIGTFRSGGDFGGTNTEAGFNLILHVITFTMQYIGSSLFVINGFIFGTGLVYIAAFVVVVVVMLRAGFALEELAPWILLGLFSIAAGFLTAIGRVGATSSYYRPVSQYTVISLLALFIIGWLKPSNSLKKQLIMVGVLALGLTWNGLFYRYSQNIVTTVFAEPMVQVDECYKRFPLNEEPCLVSIYSPTVEDMQYLPALALNNLGIYRHVTPQNVLPTAYQPGGLIVVNTRSAIMNELAQRWLLDGMPADLVLHYSDPDQRAVYDDHPFTYPMTFTAPDGAQVAASNPAQVWFLTDAEHLPTRDQIDRIYPDGWMALGITESVENTELALVGYQALPADLPGPSVRFGESAELIQWQILGEYTVPACEPVSVQSTWRLFGAPSDSPYVLSLVLSASGSGGVAQQDDLIAEAWQPGDVIRDTRTLTLPCDAAPGSYDLLMTFYRPVEGDRLMAAYMDGTPIGEYLYLTTITVP